MASSQIVNQDLDQEMAIREVARVSDLIKKLQVLLQFKKTNGDEAIQMHELAQSLFGESLQALNHALCIMKSKKTKMEIKPEIALDGTGSPAYSSHGSPVSNNPDGRIGSGKGKEEGWKIIPGQILQACRTMMAINGENMEKKINGSDFPRGYFRCTYKDKQNCKATKLVQQKNNNDPPLFDVKYANKHTCNSLKQINPPFHTDANPFISIKSYTSMQDCNHIMAQAQPLNQASVLDGCNSVEILSDASMVPSYSVWDMESFLMELGGSEGDDFFLLSR